MQTTPTYSFPQRTARAVSFCLLVASIASAIGVVISVLVLTTPNRHALMAPLPAVAWDMAHITTKLP